MPTDLATAAQLRADGLGSSGNAIAWRVEFNGVGMGPGLHTPLYKRAKAYIPDEPAHSRGIPTDLDYGITEAWSWAKFDLHRGQVIGVRTAACCGRVLEIAVTDLDGRVLCDEGLAALEGALCEICREDHGERPWEEGYERFRKVMGPGRKRRTLIGWGLADAVALEVLIAQAQRLPQYRGSRCEHLHTSWEDAQQREARGRVAWTGLGYQHARFPHQMGAVERCLATLEMIQAFKACRPKPNPRELAVPVLGKPVGPLTEYGVVTLPRELSLLLPPRQSAARPERDRTARSVLAPVEQRHTDRSTWRTPEAERTLERRESALVKAFADHLQGLGHEVWSNHISVGDRTLRTDLFDRTALVLYEAKASIEERDLRMAVGQLADYRARLGIPGLKRAVLVPQQPDQDWLAILNGEGIAVAYQEGGRFTATSQLW